ncbi:MAG TPA: TrkH family potassium uptake protein [Vicinamibacteria bacterium]
MLAGSFVVVILAGTLLLSLPAAQAGEPVSLLDTLFTATSAVCVTGLTAVDTGSRYSLLGQAVILGLIQTGGLGLMTFAVFAGVLLGRRVAFTDRMVIQDSMHHTPRAGIRRLVRYVVGFTLATEAAGALLLWLRFRGQFAAGEAVWLSVFHSVSAFCNAGFGLFSDNLVRYRGDLLVNIAVTGLVVLGGLGFLVNLELRDQVAQRLRGRAGPLLTLHARLTLLVTASLLAAGTLAFLALEWDNALRGLPLGERLLAGWFQSVTPRTAGFNTIDYGQVSPDTLFFTIVLMFVGASPGSTGGGIKTTTFGLLCALVVARWRGRGRASMFHRTIPHAVMDRALLLALLAWATVSLAVFLLVATETHGVPFGAAEPRFLALMFEAVSAFGTVGLSTGITPSLSAAGKVVLVALMFAGRVGPLTLVFAVGPRQERGRFRYAEENVMVG